MGATCWNCKDLRKRDRTVNFFRTGMSGVGTRLGAPRRLRARAFARQPQLTVPRHRPPTLSPAAGPFHHDEYSHHPPPPEVRDASARVSPRDRARRGRGPRLRLPGSCMSAATTGHGEPASSPPLSLRPLLGSTLLAFRRSLPTGGAFPSTNSTHSPPPPPPRNRQATAVKTTAPDRPAEAAAAQQFPPPLRIARSPHPCCALPHPLTTVSVCGGPSTFHHSVLWELLGATSDAIHCSPPRTSKLDFREGKG